MRKILLIDKGNSSVHNFKKTLANKGYRLINTNTLKKALTYLKNGDIDLIAIDHAFSPQAIRSGGFRNLSSNTPRIIMTRQEDPKEKRQWLREKFTAFIREPFSMNELMSCTDSILRDKKIEDENRLLREEVRLSGKKLAFYNDIAFISSSVNDIGKSLQNIMDKVKAITKAHACSLLFNEEPFFELTPLNKSKRIQSFTYKKGEGIVGRVMEKGTPLIVNDAVKDKRFNKKADGFSNVKIKSLLCVPLKIRDRSVGVLRLINKNNGENFTEKDMTLLVNAAHCASLAMERSFLYEKLKNDELTNLYNIRYLHQSIEMEIERAQRYDSIFSIVFMDMDNFKKVNDRFGHLVGSRVLIEVALLLQKNLRKIDIIARYGGDEFVIILPQTPRESSFLVAERLRKMIEKTVFLKHDGYSIRLTASFGAASFPENAGTKEELLRIADSAMYRGKFSTKNIVFSAM